MIMRATNRFSLLVVTAGLLLGVVRADDSGLKGPGLEIELIAEDRAIAPGHPFVVGLHLRHFPGFHTYWKNPGVVGMETSLDWNLPEGFSASPIQWPFPEKSFMGEYPCHGYEREVTLLVTITPPETITDDSVTLSAEAAWMCCAVGCFPGFETFTLTLPVSDEPIADPAYQKLFRQARKELPLTDPSLTATLVSKVDSPVIEMKFRREREWMGDEPLYFFSSDRQISSDQPQNFIPQDDGSLLLKIPRSDFSPEKKRTVPGVLKIGPKAYVLEAKPKA
jgi:thiol:disulfide interchange protein DsbD